MPKTERAGDGFHVKMGLCSHEMLDVDDLLEDAMLDKLMRYEHEMDL